MKKILCFCFTILFVFVCGICFINYSLNTTKIICNNMSIINIQNESKSNDELVKDIKEISKNNNTDIAFLATDNSGSKDCINIYKTNNTEDFLNVNVEGNNQRIETTEDCFTTKNEINGLKTKKLYVSSFFYDYTVQSIDNIKTYDLSDLSIYIKAENIDNVAAEFSEYGYMVSESNNLDDDSAVSALQEITLPLLLLLVSMAIYFIINGKKTVLKRMEGYSTASIFKDSFIECYKLFSAIFLIVLLINYIVTSAFYSGIFIGYFKYSIVTIIIYFLITIVMFVVSALFMNFQYGYEYINGKAKKTSLFVIVIVAKLIFSVFLICSISIAVNKAVTMNDLIVGGQRISDKVDNYVSFSLNSLSTDFSINMQENGDKAYNFFADIEKNNSACIIDSQNYQKYNNYDTFADANDQKSIIINKNYLKLNPLHKPNGELITNSDIKDGFINVLVPENSENTEQIKQDSKTIFTETEQKVNCIVYKTNEEINTFNPSTGIFSYGRLENPVIYMYDSSFVPNEVVLSYLSNGSIICKTNTADPYNELLPKLKSYGLSNMIKSAVSVNNSFNTEISNYKYLFLIELINSVLYILGLLILMIFTIQIYAEIFRSNIASKVLCGYSFWSIHSIYFVICSTLLIGLCFGCYVISVIGSVAVLWSMIIAIYVLEIVVFCIYEHIKTAKSILATMKGE